MNDIFDAIGRRFSMASEGAEDQGPVAEIEVDEAGAPLTAEETVEGEVIEATEHAEEAEETAAEAETVENTAEALESFLVASINDRRNGNYWSAQTAQSVERGFQAVIRATGGNPNFKVRELAGENFSDRRDAQSAMISFEGAVVDALKNLWQKLKDMIKKVIRHVRQFFNKHFSAVGMLKKRAEAIKKKAQTQEKAPGKGKVTVSGWSALQVNNAMPEGKVIAAHLGYFVDWTKILASQTLNSYADTLEGVTDIIDGSLDLSPANIAKTNAEQKKVTDWLGSLIDAVTTISARPFHAGGTSVPAHAGIGDDEEGAATTELCGGVKALRVTPKASTGTVTPDKIGKDLKSLRLVFIQARDKSKDLDSGKEHKRLSAGEAVSITSAVLDFCEEALRHKNSFERYEKQTDKFLAKMDKITGSSRGHEDNEAAEERLRVALAGGAASCLRNMTLWQQSVERRGLAISRAALDYCNASLNTSNSN